MRLGYLYSRYPVLSQTFCDAEMLELERREHEIILGSLYPPKTALRHEYLKKLRAPIRYAPPSRELDALARKAKRAGRWPSALVAQHEKKYGAEYKAALRARNALFFVELFEGARVRHFHVHFANRAAHTAMFVKAVSGIPFSMTAHGQDFMSDLGNDELLRELCASAEFVGAETDFSRDLLAARCPESRSKIFRVYNGIDLSRFPKPETDQRSRGRNSISQRGTTGPFQGFRYSDRCLRGIAKTRNKFRIAKLLATALCARNWRSARAGRICANEFILPASNRKITCGRRCAIAMFLSWLLRPTNAARAMFSPRLSRKRWRLGNRLFPRLSPEFQSWWRMGKAVCSFRRATRGH